MDRVDLMWMNVIGGIFIAGVLAIGVVTCIGAYALVENLVG